MTLKPFILLYVFVCVYVHASHIPQKDFVAIPGCGITKCTHGAIVFDPVPGIRCACPEDLDKCQAKRDESTSELTCIRKPCHQIMECGFSSPVRDPTSNICTCQLCPTGSPCCPSGHNCGPFLGWSKVATDPISGRCYCPVPAGPLDKKRDMSDSAVAQNSSAASTTASGSTTSAPQITRLSSLRPIITPWPKISGIPTKGSDCDLLDCGPFLTPIILWDGSCICGVPEPPPQTFTTSIKSSTMTISTGLDNNCLVMDCEEGSHVTYDEKTKTCGCSEPFPFA